MYKYIQPLHPQVPDRERFPFFLCGGIITIILAAVRPFEPHPLGT